MVDQHIKTKYERNIKKTNRKDKMKETNELANLRKMFFNLIKRELEIQKENQEIQLEKAELMKNMEKEMAKLTGVKKPDFSSDIVKIPGIIK